MHLFACARPKALLFAALLFLVACSPTESTTDATDLEDTLPELSETQDVDPETDEDTTKPAIDPAAATRGFQLYYRERVERAVVAYNRFMLFGDVGFAATIGKSGIKKTGDVYEVVAGPNDNNPIGISIWATWHAYKLFRTRLLELSLIRMFDGLAFLEAVPGHPGITSRHVVPGWTREVDGLAGTVHRSRDGQEVFAPEPTDGALEAELLATFWDGVRVTYREDPRDYLFDYMPAQEMGPYAVTYSFSMLPDYLRVSDCCTSLKKTPAPHAWEGAFWSNHNSRDNLPDLGIGFVSARLAMKDPEISDELRAAATRAVEAGQRIGDSVQEHAGCLMTVDEHNAYDELVIAGTVRPDGETEAEDLGSLSDCQMAFLGRAISSEGLSAPLPELPAPGSIEFLLGAILGGDNEVCPIPEPVRTCTRLEEAYCGKDWGTLGELEFGGTPWLDKVAEIEEKSPGMAETLIGGFQDDYHEKLIAMLAILAYAEVEGEEAVLAEGRVALSNMADLMRRYADIIYTTVNPARRVEKYYIAALFEAAGGLAVELEHLDGFARAEGQMQHIESLLTMPDTSPAALLSDEEIRQQIEAHLAGRSDTVKARYAATYGDTPPIRRAGEGYEAKGHHPDMEMPWRAVARPQHRVMGGVKFMMALPLCDAAPELLDCTWARLGCERPDLDQSGVVDEADRALYETAATTHGGDPCDDANAWCAGADLDRSGGIDELDAAFLAAAEGCTR
jgi:hypothetical protein